MKSGVLTFVLGLFSLVAFADVKVIYFHGKQRCPTCLSIEQRSHELVNERYAEELKDGKLKFMVVDISTPDGKVLAEKYKVSWSSLYVDNGKSKTDVSRAGFQYARTQPDVFKSELKDVVDKALDE